MAYVRPGHAGVGKTLAVEVGKGQAQARVVKLPFYRRADR